VARDPAGQAIPPSLRLTATGSPVHVLTAAHCLADLEPLGLSAANLAVTFNQDAWADPAPIGVTDYTIHPDAFARRAYPLDMAVLTLASPVVGIDPIDLPEPGFLSDAAAGGELRGHSFVQVGYGWVPTTAATPVPSRNPGCGCKPRLPSPD
jgi:hypothetical protein